LLNILHQLHIFKIINAIRGKVTAITIGGKMDNYYHHLRFDVRKVQDYMVFDITKCETNKLKIIINREGGV